MRDAADSRFEDLLTRVDAFYEARDWRRFQNLKDLAASAAIEVAELQQLFLWIDDEATVLRERRHEVANELADIFINLLNLSRLAGVNLLEACAQKLTELEQRYPAEAVRGRVVAKAGHDGPRLPA